MALTAAPGSKPIWSLRSSCCFRFFQEFKKSLNCWAPESLPLKLGAWESPVGEPGIVEAAGAGSSDGAAGEVLGAECWVVLPGAEAPESDVGTKLGGEELQAEGAECGAAGEVSTGDDAEAPPAGAEGS